MATEPEKPMMFVPMSSQFDLNFWHKFCDKKLNVFKLSEDPVEFHAEYNIDKSIANCLATVSYSAFENAGKYPIAGTLVNKNSIESFKSCDKMQLLKDNANKIIDEIKSGDVWKNPDTLNRMVLLSFADLKKYHFYFWAAFPSFSVPNCQYQVGSLQDVSTRLSEADLAKLVEGGATDGNFFLADKTTFKSVPLEDIKSNTNVYLGFADPSGSSENVGWTLRNFLYAVAFHMAEDSVFDVICLRGSKQHNFNKSKILTVKLKKITFNEEITYVGWEKNEKGQFGPKFINLSSSMDPTRLASSAVDLNLKLMRWRLAPELDLEKISATKCLLLGAGTLGCNVARCLMGWGVRHITFVDNSKVSYSNPVRQTLFDFEDSVQSRPKAQAAADNVKKIFPSMESSGINMSIPMPGHTVGAQDIEKTKQTVTHLEELIKSHDAIFLLLDTREARWLPTLLGAVHGKIVMNAALGFHTFLVMRHGTSMNKLGCYFCNDVVAPTNSTRDRSLDQQCTVSRPGISFMAASMVVELLVSLIQHPDGINATADDPSDDDVPETSVLGSVPHQIRCFLSRYFFVAPSTQGFSMCTACSEKVIEEYKRNGFEFLLRVFNEEGYLERFTGLSDLQQQSQDIDIVALSDDESI